jgi:hypothetical protein
MEVDLNFTDCWQSTRDFRTLAQASYNPLIKYYIIVLFINHITKLKNHIQREDWTHVKYCAPKNNLICVVSPKVAKVYWFCSIISQIADAIQNLKKTLAMFMSLKQRKKYFNMACFYGVNIFK